MKLFVAGLIIFLFPLTSDGQAFKKKQRWFRGPGMVQLTDGKKLEGEIYYSFQYSMVQVIRNNRSTQFKSDKVAYFEYFDEGFEKKRKFYSIPYDLDQNNFKELVFFEVIKELSNLALVKTQSYNNFDLSTGNFERLTEVLYFADNKGKITPYVEVIHKLTGASRRVINKTAFTAVTRKHSYKVQNYIKEQKLNEKREEDLVKILEYFDKIRS